MAAGEMAASCHDSLTRVVAGVATLELEAVGKYRVGTGRVLVEWIRVARARALVGPTQCGNEALCLRAIFCGTNTVYIHSVLRYQPRVTPSVAECAKEYLGSPLDLLTCTSPFPFYLFSLPVPLWQPQLPTHTFVLVQ